MAKARYNSAAIHGLKAVAIWAPSGNLTTVVLHLYTCRATKQPVPARWLLYFSCHGLRAVDKTDKLQASAKTKIQGTKIYGIKEAR